MSAVSLDDRSARMKADLMDYPLAAILAVTKAGRLADLSAVLLDDYLADQMVMMTADNLASTTATMWAGVMVAMSVDYLADSMVLR